jgi:REP element-mobilizing transposase RayT
MGRPLRIDAPRLVSHVYNRAVGRRAAFETDEDRLRFIGLLEIAVQKGLLEVLAYVLLGNHFHLIVRSQGTLSKALQFIGGTYARGFNERSDRSGPLWGSRFGSKPVRSRRYGFGLLRYVDDNPVEAGLVLRSVDYPFGSARWYAQSEGPAWLNRSWVEELVCERAGLAHYDPAAYARVVGGGVSPALRSIIQRRMESRAVADELDQLLDGRANYLPQWLLERARIADAMPPHAPIADFSTVQRAIQEAKDRCPSWTVSHGGRAHCGWTLVEVGLLRTAGAATFQEISAAVGVATSHAFGLEKIHRAVMLSDPSYARVVSDLAADVLRRCY